MKKLTLLLIPFIIVSCNSSSVKKDEPKDSIVPAVVKVIESEPIYITTFTSFKKKDGEMGLKTEVSKVNTAYFEIDLKSMADHKRHQPTKDLEPLTSPETLHSVSISITNEKSDPIFFKSSMDFLNYMDAHGYEMKDQRKLKYGISYTFKKK
jgi:hypothetical protein